MMKNDNADQNQPFVFNSTLGTFLQTVAFFFMCTSLGLAMFGHRTEFSIQANRTVIAMLSDAIMIHVLLALNSRLFFSIAAFLTFGSILIQLFFLFLMLFNSNSFLIGLPFSHFVIIGFCILFIATVMIMVQVFCSAALLKLSEVTVIPQPPRKIKKASKRRNVDSVEDGRDTTGTTTTNSCSHDPSCSKTSSTESSSERKGS